MLAYGAAAFLALASAASGAGPAPPRGVLAFGCEACPTTHTRELATIRTDGSGLEFLRRACGTNGDPDFPAWSPDGERLAYACNFARGGTIWTSRADGSSRRALTQVPHRVEQYGPAWSPDGRQLAWERQAFGSQTWNVVVAAADGSGERPVAKGLSPSWSRRGRLVLETGNGLATVAADGSRRWHLLGRRAGRGSPTWSPDGRSIAFIDTHPIGTALRVVDLASYGVRTLARTSGDLAMTALTSVAWSPDSHWLAYGVAVQIPSGSNTSNAGVELWTVRVADGARTLVYSGSANAIRGISWRP